MTFLRFLGEMCRWVTSVVPLVLTVVVDLGAVLVTVSVSCPVLCRVTGLFPSRKRMVCLIVVLRLLSLINRRSRLT